MRTRRQSCTLLLAACGLALSQSGWADTNALKMRFAFDAAPVNNVIVDTLGHHPGTVAGAQWAATEGDRSGVMHFTVPAVPQITIAPTPDFNGTAGSIAFWMKSGPNSGPGNAAAILFDRRVTEGDIIVLVDDGTLVVQSKAASFATTQTVNNDQWHHITYVFDQTAAGSVAIYIDGVLDTSAANSREWSWNPEQPIELGRSHDGFWRRYNGSMDDFMWYNRALTPEQVATLAAGTVDTSGLVCRLDFAAAPEGDVLVDSSPDGLNPGTNVGANWAASVAGRNGVMQFAPIPANQITVPPAADLDSLTTTICFWMKSAGNTDPGGNGAAIIFDRRTAAGDVIVLGDDGTLTVQATYTGSGVVNQFTTINMVNDDQWHHITYTADQSFGGLTEIYIDGVLDTAQANTRAWLWPTNQQIELGKSHDPFWRKYTGFLDEFQIYNQVLTPEQIQFIANPSGPGAIMPDPFITVHPQSAIKAPGTAVTMSVAATGTGTLSYQWQKGGTDVTGQTSATLSLPSAALSDAGVYRCVVTSSVGQSISLEATLTVGVTPELTLNLYPGINMTGTPGLHYRVEYAEAVSPTQWLTLTNIAALPASPFFVLDPQAATHPSRYYRALLLP